MRSGIKLKQGVKLAKRKGLVEQAACIPVPACLGFGSPAHISYHFVFGLVFKPFAGNFFALSKLI